MCVWHCEAKSQPMHGTVTFITQMRGWVGAEGLHGQGLLYAALWKPLWMLGPHFKWLFILALITRSNPKADTVGCVCVGGLECKAEFRSVPLTKHYFSTCPVALGEAPQQPWWVHNTKLLIHAGLFTWQYCQTRLQLCISESFLLLIVAAWCNQFSVIRHNGGHSCLRGCMHLLGVKKTKKTEMAIFLYAAKTEISQQTWPILFQQITYENIINLFFSSNFFIFLGLCTKLGET